MIRIMNFCQINLIPPVKKQGAPFSNLCSPPADSFVVSLGNLGIAEVSMCHYSSHLLPKR